MKSFEGLLLPSLLLIFSSSCSSIRVLVGPDHQTYQAIILTLTNRSVSEACTIEVPEFPIPDVYGHSQTFIDGKLVICGGTGPGGFHFEFCFELDYDKLEWLNFPPLPSPRSFATGLWIDNGTKWWLTGGSLGQFDQLNSTVYYDTWEGSWSVGPEIPSPRGGHCIVNLLDGTRLFFAGYTSDSGTNNFFYRQHQDGSWKKMRGFTNIDRHSPRIQTCALLPNGDVMNLGSDEDQVDDWNSEWGYWRIEEDFKLPVKYPENMQYPGSIADEDGTIYVIGGGTYQYRASDILVWRNDQWQILEEVLPIPVGEQPQLTPITNEEFTCQETNSGKN